MVSKELTINNDTGLHSRPADLSVRTAKLYTSRITVWNKDKSADAKNIVRVILINANAGSAIKIEADGEDEQEALNALIRLIESDFADVDDRIEI